MAVFAPALTLQRIVYSQRGIEEDIRESQLHTNIYQVTAVYTLSMMGRQGYSPG